MVHRPCGKSHAREAASPKTTSVGEASAASLAPFLNQTTGDSYTMVTSCAASTPTLKRRAQGKLARLRPPHRERGGVWYGMRLKRKEIKLPLAKTRRLARAWL